MRAWVVESAGVLRQESRPEPAYGTDELLVRVEASGVCRTDLHVLDGELPVHRPRVVPGHEVVGTVVEAGASVDGQWIGARVGVPWLRRACGTCPQCTRGRENLCPYSLYTGWDADGGYADLVTVPAAFAYRLAPDLDPVTTAPLLCAGIIGYRALRLSDLPPSGNLGIYGFGGSAHITAQAAIAEGARVHVLTRSANARRLALDLGCASAQSSDEGPPVPLDAAILFAPVGELVPVVLAALAPGGTLSVAGIHVSDVPALNYQRHLFFEKTVRSVTANTREDGRALLALARDRRFAVEAQRYEFAAADRALDNLRAGRVNGAAVLVLNGQ
ncbi:MAG: zinc-dependent alcohol dehydrogenase family protein [Streptosporangiales bacterium]